MTVCKLGYGFGASNIQWVCITQTLSSRSYGLIEEQTHKTVAGVQLGKSSPVVQINHSRQRRWCYVNHPGEVRGQRPMCRFDSKEKLDQKGGKDAPGWTEQGLELQGGEQYVHRPGSLREP